jgi:hypothetical protein
MQRVRNIGKGGLGCVDLYQNNEGNFYAVKQMLYAWDSDHFERFKREMGAVANCSAT